MISGRRESEVSFFRQWFLQNTTQKAVWESLTHDLKAINLESKHFLTWREKRSKSSFCQYMYYSMILWEIPQQGLYLVKTSFWRYFAPKKKIALQQIQSDAFADYILRFSHNTKIFQIKKHYTPQMNFFWNAASELSMQDENIETNLHVIFGLVATEKCETSFVG